MRATAIIPVKRFDDAKRRLDRGLAAPERRDLAELMLIDVLDAVGQCSMIERVIVVTGEQIARAQAEEREFEVVFDVSDSGHSQAALLGIKQAQAHRAQCVVLLPGDCPLLDPAELDDLLGGVVAPSVTIIPDRHGAGTNGLVLAPPDAIEPSFGPASCARHAARAAEADISHAVAQLASMGLDIDTPADLEALREIRASSRAEAALT